MDTEDTEGFEMGPLVRRRLLAGKQRIEPVSGTGYEDFLCVLRVLRVKAFGHVA
jgi:hypothetical protein